MPGDRTYVTSLIIGNYFRLSPDGRLIWGGRARFSATLGPALGRDRRRDPEAGPRAIFPQLAGVEIDYCWGGLVGMTRDRFPRAGEADG